MSDDISTIYREILAGEPAAEARLFRFLDVSFRMFVRHRIVNAQDREEVVQDALATIAAKYMSVQIETSFAGWAHKVLSNKILDYYKSKRVRAERQVAIEVAETFPGSPAVRPELKKRLLACLRKLHGVNCLHARVLNLHYQGYTTEEICSKLSISSGNLYVMLSRARTLLQLCLEKGDVEQ